ncbi:MAG: hypothetical protein KZQ74_03045 [gamma proteobacterium symbiont of Bathyaustriella thionipta]|nr:hypothetical protein [gamma proteobacterium symbiont of Bathyaustriella thionipta]MCU7951516.1 hypothetical protein [gamma proteobacterium symbiont of Bathyaustriella thionipta]MCU7958090.1 hypothetical protein [gamma proteobacterium symbiont of Bathyaustriella thionipta]MCU7966163.1 hypothetical protein [gamma proteobacterium symbiont of Bathyaustriella thionipta]
MKKKKLFISFIIQSLIISVILFIAGVSLVKSDEIDKKDVNTKKQDSSSENKKKTKSNKWSRKSRFVPSEKIDADSSVSFPVDI